MEKVVEKIAGDTEGVAYEFPVFRFEGASADAPSAYIQAALHAGELPGTVAIDALMPLLVKAEKERRIRGRLTIVPWANPVGRAQYHFGDLEGRFHLGTRVNFNRDFPLLERPDLALLPPEDEPKTVDRRLKRKLISLSLGHDIVLDLHCDDEGVAYLYVPAELWPAMQDCAAAMGVAAVVTWQAPSGGSFDEASLHPWLKESPEKLAGRVVTTVEYRGLADVGYDHAQADALGLYRLLVARGVIEDRTVSAPGKFAGLVAPIDHVEMIAAPRAGAILFDVSPGERVKQGARLASIVHAPGEPDGSVEVLSPQSGYVLTRASRRSTRAGDDIVKLVGDKPSVKAKAGALED
jgi:predicted deacylase